MATVEGGTRLQKLLHLLHGGSTPETRRAGASQVCALLQAHPAQLPAVLDQVAAQLASPEWDTRVAAAHCLGLLADHFVGIDARTLARAAREGGPPSEAKDRVAGDGGDAEGRDAEDGGAAGVRGSETGGAAKDGGQPDVPGPPSPYLLSSLEALDVSAVLKSAPPLLASGGEEYEGRALAAGAQRAALNRRLGLGGPGGKGIVDSGDWIADADLDAGGGGGLGGDGKAGRGEPAGTDAPRPASQPEAPTAPVSARERLAAARKAKALAKAVGRGGGRGGGNAARGRRGDEGEASGAAASAAGAPAPPPSPPAGGGGGPAAGGAVPPSASVASIDAEAVAAAAAAALDPSRPFWLSGRWPFQAVADRCLADLTATRWETRHGAAAGLRELLRSGARAGGVRARVDEARPGGWSLPGGRGPLAPARPVARAEAARARAANVAWLGSCCTRLLETLARDRFSDFVGASAVAPVRETAAQALGAASAALPARVLPQVVAALRLLASDDAWQARHGGLLGLKYLIAVRADELGQRVGEPGVGAPPAAGADPLEDALESALWGLRDPDDDVRAAAAEALTPLSRRLAVDPSPLAHGVRASLWDLLPRLDELSPAAGAVLRLLGLIYSQGAAGEACSRHGRGGEEGGDEPLPAGDGRAPPPRLPPLEALAPRLYPYFSHALASVRGAALLTLGLLCDGCGVDAVAPDPPALRALLLSLFRSALAKGSGDGEGAAAAAAAAATSRPLGAPPTCREAAAAAWRRAALEAAPGRLAAALPPRLLAALWNVAGTRPGARPQYAAVAALSLDGIWDACVVGAAGEGASPVDPPSPAPPPAPSDILGEADACFPTAAALERAGRAAQLPAPEPWPPRDDEDGEALRRALGGMLGDVAAKEVDDALGCGEARAAEAAAEDPRGVGVGSAPAAVPDAPSACPSPPGLAGTVPRRLPPQAVASANAPPAVRLVLSNLGGGSASARTVAGAALRAWSLRARGEKEPGSPAGWAATPVPGPASPLHSAVLVEALDAAYAALCEVPPAYLELRDYPRDPETQKSAWAELHRSACASAAAGVAASGRLPDRLNGLVQPLVAEARRARSRAAREAAAEGLARLVVAASSRSPNPNDKIVRNIVTFAIADAPTPAAVPASAPTPAAVPAPAPAPAAGAADLAPAAAAAAGGVGLTAAARRATGAENGAASRPAAPPPAAASEAMLLARLGGAEVLRQIARRAGAALPRAVPSLGVALIRDPLEALARAVGAYEREGATVPPRALAACLSSLRLVRVLAGSLHPEIASSWLPRAAELSAAAARLPASFGLRAAAVAALSRAAAASPDAVVPAALRAIAPALEPAAPDAAREGGVAALAALADELGLAFVPWAPLAVPPLLALLGDPGPETRASAAAALATLLALLPLAWGDGAGAGPDGAARRRHRRRAGRRRSRVAVGAPASAGASEDGRSLGPAPPSPASSSSDEGGLEAGSGSSDEGGSGREGATCALAPPGLDAEQRAKLAEARTFLTSLLDPRGASEGGGAEAGAATLSRIPRPYQREGIAWLDFLRRARLHGILADDMGLGKTLQTCAVLALAAADEEARCRVGTGGRNGEPAPGEDAEEGAPLEGAEGIPESASSPAPTPGAPTPLPSLVVCPSTLVAHWGHELAANLKRPLRVCQYAGAPAARAAARAKLWPSAHVVVASYETVRSDVAALREVQWLYIVADEGHVLRDPSSKISAAVRSLRARHRLLLSGTPIQNDVGELWSLFDWLIPGFLGTSRAFSARFGKALSAGKAARVGKLGSRGAPSGGAARGQPSSDAPAATAAATAAAAFDDPERARSGSPGGTLAPATVEPSAPVDPGILALGALHRQVRPFILRRTKASVLADLPPKIIQDVLCDASPLQLELLEAIEADAAAGGAPREGPDAGEAEGALEARAPGGAAPEQRGALASLLRLRQLCSHPALVLDRSDPTHVAAARRALCRPGDPDPRVDWDAAVRALKARAGVSPKLVALRDLLVAAGVVDEEAAAAAEGGSGGDEPGADGEADGIAAEGEGDAPGEAGARADARPPSRGAQGRPGTAAAGPASPPPASVEAGGSSDSGHRVLVFAQLREVLDLVEACVLNPLGVPFVRLDGSVPPTDRFERVQRFNADPSIPVMLLTTGVGGLGLNLTSADTVVFLEHDWNPQRDLQAMDRAHRLGQRRTVNVYRLLVRNSLEEQILGLQAWKLGVADAVVNAENASTSGLDSEAVLDAFGGPGAAADGGGGGPGGAAPASAAAEPSPYDPDSAAALTDPAAAATAAAAAAAASRKRSQSGMRSVLDSLAGAEEAEGQYSREFDVGAFAASLKRRRRGRDVDADADADE